MTNPETVATIPAAWLNPLPEGYKIPVWRWILVPAYALMLSRSGGVWVSGELSLRQHDLYFVQSSLLKSARKTEWTIPLADISDVTLAQGFASETIHIRHAGGLAKVMSARASDFVVMLDAAASKARNA